MAPVDWEADGDLDMLCGTATGKLLLLRDPNVGKPSNLRATAGYDNVLLTWDPNGQSRVYGYGVYRAQGADFARIAEASLPTHRDTPPSLATWSYRVTALSRLWTAGNSVPETFESLPSDTVSVTLGGITLSMPEALISYDDAEIALPIVVDNTKGLTYDPAIVEPLGYEPTALTEGLAVTSTPVNGTWTLSATGTLTAGSGPLFRLRFHVKTGAFGETALRLTEATFTATDGKSVATNALPIETTLTVQARPLPATVTLRMEDAQAKTGETVRVPVTIEAAAPIDWSNASKLLLVSRTEATESAPTLTLIFEVLEQHGDDLFATVTVVGTATSANGLPATVLPATATISITDSNPPVPAIVTLTTTDVPANVGETITVTVAARSEGDLLWETLSLTPDFDKSCLELLGQTPATASMPATFSFKVLERFGVNLATAITFSGTAMSANGLAATVGSVTCRVLIADNPQEPAVVSLSLPNQTVDTLSRVSLTVEATAVGEVEWDTLALHAQWDASKLDLVSQEGRTFVFDVKDVHEDLSTTMTITGTATSTNGLPAIVQPATCTLTFIDTNPPVPAVVTLAAEGGSAMTESEVTLAVRVSTVGELDWGTLALTATVEAGGLELRSQTAATVENPTATFTFWVPEQHGDDLFARVTFTGSATSANGLPAQVAPTTVTLALTDSNPPKDPTEVPPWSSGDVDGDGKLTWDDYATARAAILKYHRPTIRPPSHSSDPNATDNKVHRSICQALGRGENETLSIADITAFQRYLEGILGEMPKEATR